MDLAYVLMQFLSGSCRNLMNCDESHGRACCRIKKINVEGRNENGREGRTKN